MTPEPTTAAVSLLDLETGVVELWRRGRQVGAAFPWRNGMFVALWPGREHWCSSVPIPRDLLAALAARVCRRADGLN